MHTETARTLRERFLRGEHSAEEITSYFLERIERLNPQVGAFLSVLNERALNKARALDAKRARGETLGKLAGIPIAIKDNILIKGELNTCASKFLNNYRAIYDATVTRLLEAEGAILLGKTNLDEFAMGSSTEHSALLETRNPWNLACSAGGSSGGSAVAVASRLCPLALGSDTGGSVRQPAALCGIVGYKPTYGRISRYGLVAFGSSFDQIGPFATNTQDAALLMEVLGQHCGRDSTSLQGGPEKYLEDMHREVRGSKVGVPWDFLKDLPEQTRAVFEKSLDTLRGMGAEIVDVDLSLMQKGIAAYYILTTAEASTNLARFDGVRYGQRSQEAKSLNALYDLSKEEGYGPEVKRRIMLGTFVLSSGHKDDYYRKAQKVRTLMIRAYEAAFSQCDVIATPVTPGGAFEIGSHTDPLHEYLEDAYTVPVNLAGIPAISLPSGFTHDGKPLGLQLAGPQRADVDLFRYAHAFEQAHMPEAPIPELAK